MQLCLNTINIRNSQPGVVPLVLYPFTNHFRSQPFKVKELCGCLRWYPDWKSAEGGWRQRVVFGSQFRDAPGPWSSHRAVQLTPGL